MTDNTKTLQEVTVILTQTESDFIAEKLTLQIVNPGNLLYISSLISIQ
jgi:hypothetical protein